jgi:hypothetical protein
MIDGAELSVDTGGTFVVPDGASVVLLRNGPFATRMAGVDRPPFRDRRLG